MKNKPTDVFFSVIRWLVHIVLSVILSVIIINILYDNHVGWGCCPPLPSYTRAAYSAACSAFTTVQQESNHIKITYDEPHLYTEANHQKNDIFDETKKLLGNAFDGNKLEINADKNGVKYTVYDNKKYDSATGVITIIGGKTETVRYRKDCIHSPAKYYSLILIFTLIILFVSKAIFIITKSFLRARRLEKSANLQINYEQTYVVEEVIEQDVEQDIEEEKQGEQ